MVNVIEVDPHTLKSWLDEGSATLIDVREENELENGWVSGAIHNPMSNFDFSAVPVNNSKKLIFMCAHGIRSHQVCTHFVEEKIIPKTYNLTGGVAAWHQSGLPLKNSTKLVS